MPSETRSTARATKTVHSKTMEKYTRRRRSRVRFQSWLLWTCRGPSITSGILWSQKSWIISSRRMPSSTLRSNTARAWISLLASYSSCSEMNSSASRHWCVWQIYLIWAISTKRNYLSWNYSSINLIDWLQYNYLNYINTSRMNRLIQESSHQLGLSRNLRILCRFRINIFKLTRRAYLMINSSAKIYCSFGTILSHQAGKACLRWVCIFWKLMKLNFYNSVLKIYWIKLMSSPRSYCVVIVRICIR